MCSDTSVEPCFLQRLRSIVDLHPNRPAIVVDGVVRLTYSQLWANSDQLASAIASLLSSSEPVVGLQLPKSADYVVALIAVWKAGAAWVPLEISLAKSQRDYMADDCAVRLVIADVVDSAAQRPTFRIDQLMEIGSQSGDANAVQAACAKRQLAYVIYTSGTTGKPRGVAVEHTGIMNLIDNQRLAFGITEESRCLLYYPICFDASVSDIGTALLSGAALCIEKQLTPQTADTVLEVIRERQITHADLPPSLLNELSVDAAPDCLQTIIIGGQACDVATVRKWATMVRLVNVYGPTEATVCCSLCQCDSGWDRPLIGQPITGIEYVVLDENQKVVSPGQFGELLIGGFGVARGYLNQPEATSRKFILFEGRRFYRSGDRVRLDHDGEFVFAGRIDRQINHNGMRIEPEEIEILVSSFPGVTGSAVLLRKLHERAPRESLVVFIETDTPHVSEADITDWVQQNLPRYKFRPLIRKITALPRLASGKYDYTALASMTLADASGAEAEPVSEMERDVLQILREVLCTEAISVDDDFFAFGGDSLAAVQVSALAAAQGLVLPGWVVNSHRTARSIASELNESLPTSAGFRCSTEWLRRDVASITIPVVVTTDPPNSNRTITLLTGATGFLGCRILERLILEADVVCLVRGTSLKDATSRLWKNLQRQEVFVSDEKKKRIRIVVGDVSQPRLGLSQTEYDELTSTVGQVVQCAAAVDSLRTYPSLRASNLVATNEVLRFVCDCGGCRLDYISTLSVFAGTDRCAGQHLETDDLSKAGWVYGGYAQSKWASEILLQKFIDKNPALKSTVAIYRLGLLTGDTRTGVAPSKDVLTMAVRGLQELECVPEPLPDICFDMTPVNFAAEAIVAISGSAISRNACHAWHIAGREPVSAKQLFEFLRNLGITLNPVPHDHFKERVKHASAEASMAWLSLARWLTGNQADQFRANDLFQATDCSFDTRYTQQLLNKHHIKCPFPDDLMLKQSLGRTVQIACKPNVHPTSNPIHTFE